MATTFTLYGFRFYEDDSGESSETAIDAFNTNIGRTITTNNQLCLRLGVTASGGSGTATDDWQLQVAKNGVVYNDISLFSSNVQGFNSSNLTDGGSTTAILDSPGIPYTFSSGLISEDGLADNLEIDILKYTEILFTIKLIFVDLITGDTLDFRILNNSNPITYTVTPRITITKIGSNPFVGDRRKSGAVGVFG